MTWAADDNLYTAWGDGGGFEGREGGRSSGRASLGFAVITGVPRAGDPASYQGHNIWGTLPFAQYQATFGGKVSDLISLDGTLYAQGKIWTRINCRCWDPTQKGDGGSIRTVLWSKDLGKSWTLAPWTAPSELGSTLQFGPDYGGALDPAHVYLYYQRNADADRSRVYLRRVDKDAFAIDPATPGHFEYFAGRDDSKQPRWSGSESEATPVFVDAHVPQGVPIAPKVVYNAALGRYMMTAFHGPLTGQIGVFEAPQPWGPWSTVVYYEDWGGFNETAGKGTGIAFPAKWISADGRTLWAVFSGLKTSQQNHFDSFNLAVLKVRTRHGLPRIESTGADAHVSAGARIKLRGTGSNLAWLVSRMRLQAHEVRFERIGAGSGRSLEFTVPGDIGAGEVVRVTLSNDALGTSVFRDFVAGPNQ